MKTGALYISKKNDNTTWCLPSEGYIYKCKIESEDYEEIETIQIKLPANEEDFPFN